MKAEPEVPRGSTCEWDPRRNRPAQTLPPDIELGCRNQASVSIGGGAWHLCVDCAALPRFAATRSGSRWPRRAARQMSSATDFGQVHQAPECASYGATRDTWLKHSLTRAFPARFAARASVKLEVGEHLGVMSQVPMNPLRPRLGADPSSHPQAPVREYK